MKNLIKTIALSTILISGFTQANTEYYLCEDGVDKYWKFNTDLIDSINPLAESGALLSMWSGVQSFPVTTYNKSWYKVVVSTDLQMTYFINREGGKSLMRVSENTEEMGVCHRAEGSPEMKRRFLNTEQLSEIKASQNSTNINNWN